VMCRIRIRLGANPNWYQDPTISLKCKFCIYSFSFSVLWNRNRRNRNFLTSGTGTATCQKVVTGTVINYGSGTNRKTV
jgi:hypothetical protein